MAKLLHCLAVLGVAVTINFPALAAAAETDEAAALDAKVVELYRAGKLSEAIPLAETALAIRNNGVDPDNPDVVPSLNNLAALYQSDGRYPAAEELYRRALKIRLPIFGLDHPAVVQSMNNLAALYQVEGRYPAAEQLYRQVLAIHEKTLGEDNPSVATTLNNLATISQSEGRLEEAERLYERALVVRKRIGADDPAVATTINNLAAFYQKQGRLPDAERWYIRALDIREKALDREHPDIGQSLNNLAALYQSEGRYAEAEPLFQRALAIYENALAPDRIEVGWTVTNLANLYEDQGRFSDAEQLRKRAPSIRPTAPEQKPVPPTAPPAAAANADRGLVEFLFASTRQKVAGASSAALSYSGERGPLSFGSASVRIPPDRDRHGIGHIERPSNLSLFGITLSSTPNEQEQFVIKRVASISEAEIDQFIKKKGAKTALVFVHGFNTSFESALYRHAQLAFDLQQYTALTVLFTWPSRGRVPDYIYDMQSAYLARDAFVALLEKLKRDYGVEQVNVLAHSMGSLIVLDALANYARTSNPIKITHLVMAAPDVDRDQFQTLAPIAKTIVGGMTIYVSSADRALVASRKLAGGVPRAGDVPADGPIILPNVETIDVTAMGEDLFGLNHSVFAASRDVLEDINALLRLNLPTPRLLQIHPVPDPPAPAQYWRFAR